MQLSIVIVNYNAKHLLEQCLDSLKEATTNIDHEIIIVDNNSTDQSKEYLQSKFPEVKYILNKENTGFAKACNQGYKLSTGKYILFLNPDTIMPGNSLKECISFLDSNKDVGAIGVRMIDGNGNFLKESKRGFPSPAASFYKLFGFAAIFPTSRLFAKYYMGNLPEGENKLVEVLSGAFMMVRRVAFEKTGGFDEDFFMYGEDIDLSYRLGQAGYKNYYLGTITITHLKGGSTTFDRKYVQDFYGAMKLFVKKHYSNKPALYKAVLNSGIGLRKFIALVGLMFR